MTTSTDVQRRGKEFFSAWSPAQRRFALSETQLDMLIRLSDFLIPSDGIWPVPSSTELRSYIARGARREADVRMLQEVVTVLTPALQSTARELNEAIAQLQSSKPITFRVLLEFVYYGYYAQHEVVRTIREALNCDYISPPQPRGYEMPADVDLHPARNHSYVATDEIKRVDLSGIDLTDR